MSDVQQCRITELRELLGDCVAAMRVAQPEIARQPFRLALEQVAHTAELALMHPEAS